MAHATGAGDDLPRDWTLGNLLMSIKDFAQENQGVKRIGRANIKLLQAPRLLGRIAITGPREVPLAVIP